MNVTNNLQLCSLLISFEKEAFTLFLLEPNKLVFVQLASEYLMSFQRKEIRWTLSPAKNKTAPLPVTVLQAVAVPFPQAVVRYLWHVLSPGRWLAGSSSATGLGRYFALYQRGDRWNKGKHFWDAFYVKFIQTLFFLSSCQVYTFMVWGTVQSIIAWTCSVCPELRALEAPLGDASSRRSAAKPDIAWGLLRNICPPSQLNSWPTLSVLQSGLREHRWRLILSWPLHITAEKLGSFVVTNAAEPNSKGGPCWCTRASFCLTFAVFPPVVLAGEKGAIFLSAASVPLQERWDDSSCKRDIPDLDSVYDSVSTWQPSDRSSFSKCFNLSQKRCLCVCVCFKTAFTRRPASQVCVPQLVLWIRPTTDTSYNPAISQHQGGPAPQPTRRRPAASCCCCWGSAREQTYSSKLRVAQHYK